MQLQLLCHYIDAAGRSKLRVTTIARKWAGANELALVGASFDQEAAAVLTARLVSWRAQREEVFDVMRCRTVVLLLCRLAAVVLLLSCCVAWLLYYCCCFSSSAIAGSSSAVASPLVLLLLLYCRYLLYCRHLFIFSLRSSLPSRAGGSIVC